MATNSNFEPATPEEVAFVLKELGTTEEDVKLAVKKIREWLEMQPHLPNNIADSYIESLFIQCKCSMERTKQGVDAYFSLKQRMPQLLMMRDPLGADIERVKNNIKIVIPPRLTKEGYRIIIFTLNTPDPSTYHFGAISKVVGMIVEMLMREERNLADISIIDLAKVSMGHVVRTNINDIKNAEVLYRTAYCRRVKGLHYVNTSKIFDAILKLIKSSLSEKLQKRVHTHLPGSVTLFDHVNRECIPDELGGTAGPIEKFNYNVFNKTYDMRDWFLEQDNYVSDESKRPPDNKYFPDIYGVEGSFRKLSVD